MINNVIRTRGFITCVAYNRNRVIPQHLGDVVVAVAYFTLYTHGTFVKVHTPPEYVYLHGQNIH